jgi:hypothetical protein
VNTWHKLLEFIYNPSDQKILDFLGSRQHMIIAEFGVRNLKLQNQQYFEISREIALCISCHVTEWPIYCGVFYKDVLPGNSDVDSLPWPSKHFLLLSGQRLLIFFTLARKNRSLQTRLH